VRPVLLYYAFLNLSKAYGVAKGNTGLVGTAHHGISSEAKANKIPQSLAGGPFKPGFGLSGAVPLLDRVFLPLVRVFVSSLPTRSPACLTAG